MKCEIIIQPGINCHLTTKGEGVGKGGEEEEQGWEGWEGGMRGKREGVN